MTAATPSSRSRPRSAPFRSDRGRIKIAIVWRPLNKFALRVDLALGVDAQIKSGHSQLCSSLPGPDPAIRPWSPRGGRPARHGSDQASGGSYLRDTTLVSRFKKPIAAVLAAVALAGLAPRRVIAQSSDQTLEIAPRYAPQAPPEPAPPASAATPDSTAPASDENPAAPPDAGAAAANRARPYLGMTVQAIYAADQPGKLITGLEVVSVDPGGPAARAGLHGRTKMSSLGETGTTAGALLPPLDIVMMPLLKRAGSLGRGGDLIVAIDDKRVRDNLDLQTALSNLKPGDTIYFTIVRTMPDHSLQTLKLPVKLGDAADVTAAAANGGQ